jgi:hypothetical protein
LPAQVGDRVRVRVTRVRVRVRVTRVRVRDRVTRGRVRVAVTYHYKKRVPPCSCLTTA